MPQLQRETGPMSPPCVGSPLEQHHLQSQLRHAIFLWRVNGTMTNPMLCSTTSSVRLTACRNVCPRPHSCSPTAPPDSRRGVFTLSFTELFNSQFHRGDLHIFPIQRPTSRWQGVNLKPSGRKKSCNHAHYFTVTCLTSVCMWPCLAKVVDDCQE